MARELAPAPQVTTIKTDSASLSYQIVHGKVIGTLAFNFAEKDDSHGDIKGEFK